MAKPGHGWKGRKGRKLGINKIYRAETERRKRGFFAVRNELALGRHGEAEDLANNHFCFATSMVRYGHETNGRMADIGK